MLHIHDAWTAHSEHWHCRRQETCSTSGHDLEKVSLRPEKKDFVKLNGQFQGVGITSEVSKREFLLASCIDVQTNAVCNAR